MYKYMLMQRNYGLVKLENILNSVGRPDLQLNQNNLLSKNISQIIKKTLIDQYEQTGKVQVLQSNKGLIYNSFKQDFCFQVLPQKLSTLFFEFRTANHRLPIETGGYDGTVICERTCRLCIGNKVGSEKHYLLECEFFDE